MPDTLVPPSTGVRDAGRLRKIYFSTDGTWSAEEVEGFFGTMDALYELILEGMTREMYGTRRPSAASGGWGEGTLREVMHEIDGEYAFHTTRQEISSACETSFRPQRRPAPYALHVDKIQMASPGKIVLVGLGEVIEQLRELLKDLTGRNRLQRDLLQEEINDRRWRRRLELIEFARPILREHGLDGLEERASGLPAPLITEREVYLSDILSHLEQLQKRGLLPSVQGDLDEESDDT